MSNNILQWNPSKNNQESDSTYSTDVMRTGGAVPGIFTKELANKLFFQVTTVCSALGEMMSNKGYNISDADISVLITAFANILTKADFGTTAGTVCQGNDPRLGTEIPSGTPMWFYKDTAPTGWTIDATAADAVIAVKGGSSDYSTTGGSQAGSWTQPGHTLTIAELPPHFHPINLFFSSTAYSGGISSGQFYNGMGSNIQYTQSEGGGLSHNHGTTWRPLANVGIIATKN